MMRVKRLVKDVLLPSRANATDIGWDLYAYIPEQRLTLLPGERTVIRTGIAVQFIQSISVNIYGRIAPRSGLAVKQGLDVLAGVVDPGYTGEIKVCVINLGHKPIYIKNEDRIAQLIPTMSPKINGITEVTMFDNSDRGDNGFGSSGK